MDNKKKEILELLDTVLKNTRSGNTLAWTDSKAMKKLKVLLGSTDTWSYPVSRSNKVLIINRKTRGRTYKCFVILVGDKKYYVTKASIKRLGEKPTPKRTLVLAALRFAIHEDIQRFKKTKLDEWKMLTNRKYNPLDYHVDHVIPFIKLACEWAKSMGYKSFDDVPGGKDQYNNWRLPVAVAESWVEFHEKNGELSLIPAKVNLRESSKGYEAEF